MRPRAVPNLSDNDRGAQDDDLAAAQLIPASKQVRVPRPGNLDENVGVDQNRFQGATLLIRLPLRSRRT